jgi:hypothetical protein
LGVVDTAGQSASGAVVDFGGQHFGQVAQVGLPFPVGDIGQRVASARTVGRCSSR